MAQLGTLQFSFLCLNVFFWAIGIGLVGFVSWTLSSLPSSTDFLSAAFGFLYACLLLGIFIAITGLLGCMGGLFRGVLLLKLYVGFMIAFVFIEVGLVIAVYVEHDEIPTVIAETWKQLNNDTKFEIQKSLECCGVYNYTEYSTVITSLPQSCFKVYDTLSVATKAAALLFTAGCLDQIQSWLEKNLPIWACVLVLAAIIQIASMLVSGLLLKQIGIKRKVIPIDEVLSRRSSITSNHTDTHTTNLENDRVSITSVSTVKSTRSQGNEQDDIEKNEESNSKTEENDEDNDSGLHQSSTNDVERFDENAHTMGAVVALHKMEGGDDNVKTVGTVVALREVEGGNENVEIVEMVGALHEVEDVDENGGMMSTVVASHEMEGVDKNVETVCTVAASHEVEGGDKNVEIAGTVAALHVFDKQVSNGDDGQHHMITQNQTENGNDQNQINVENLTSPHDDRSDSRTSLEHLTEDNVEQAERDVNVEDCSNMVFIDDIQTTSSGNINNSRTSVKITGEETQDKLTLSNRKYRVSSQTTGQESTSHIDDAERLPKPCDRGNSPGTGKPELF